jgi:hypothetical protein
LFSLIKTATDHGHIFWIQDGSIRSDINLEESITIDLHFLKKNSSNEHSDHQSMASITSPLENGYIFIHLMYFLITIDLDPIQMFKDDLFTSDSNTNIDNLTIINESQLDIKGTISHLDFSPKSNQIPEETVIYLDLFTSNQISPYFIVSFREYILVVSTKICSLVSLDEKTDYFFAFYLCLQNLFD